MSLPRIRRFFAWHPIGDVVAEVSFHRILRVRDLRATTAMPTLFLVADIVLRNGFTAN
jgi:hypothetical protein